MKKIIYVIILVVLLSSCIGSREKNNNVEQKEVNNKEIKETTIKVDDNQSIDNKVSINNTWVLIDTKSEVKDNNKIDDNNKLSSTFLEQPYKYLYDIKWWTLLDNSNSNEWKYKAKNWDLINIGYHWNPFWWSNVFKINNIEISSINNCIKRENDKWGFIEDDSVIIKSKCLEYFIWFSFNWKKIEHKFTSTIDGGIYVSKNKSKIALYGWELIIDFNKNKYFLNDKPLSLEKVWYILLITRDQMMVN